jgi:hypothetical protein
METIDDKIFKILKTAGSIKDKIESCCKIENLYYYRSLKVYAPCKKCFPNQPERSKREDSQKCEMRCSEHCGNTVREAQ